MEQGKTELITLLKAFVCEVPLAKEDIRNIDASLADVLHLAKLHNVMGIWAYKVREYYEQNGITNADEQELSETAQQIYAHNVARSIKREACFQKLSQLLSEAGIDHLAFKGIVVKDLYSVPELRSFGDIDFAIRPEDRERCHALMQEHGYTTATGFEPVYAYQKNLEYYEIHTSIMAVNITDRANYIEYFQNFWDYATPVQERLWEFTPEFHFIYLLSHIAKHIYSSGAGIRMYLDLAFYIKRLGNTINWGIVQDELQKLELLQFYHLTLTCLNRWFNVALPVPVTEFDKELLIDFEAFTFSGGVFGFEGRKSGEQLVRKKGLKKNALRDIFFPSATTIQSRYTYLKKHPCLLPIAWLDRLIRNFNKIGFKLVQSRDIITMNDKTIENNKKFYRKIGL